MGDERLEAVKLRWRPSNIRSCDCRKACRCYLGCDTSMLEQGNQEAQRKKHCFILISDSWVRIDPVILITFKH